MGGNFVGNQDILLPSDEPTNWSTESRQISKGCCGVAYYVIFSPTKPICSKIFKNMKRQHSNLLFQKIGEGESVLCEGIWNGNLQFCPKWLSEGLYRSKITCPIQWDAVNRLFSQKTCFLTTFLGISGQIFTLLSMFLDHCASIWIRY